MGEQAGEMSETGWKSEKSRTHGYYDFPSASSLTESRESRPSRDSRISPVAHHASPITVFQGRSRREALHRTESEKLQGEILTLW